MSVSPTTAAKAKDGTKGRPTDAELERRAQDLRKASAEDPTVTPSPFINGPGNCDSTDAESSDEESWSARAVSSLKKGSDFGNGWVV